MRRLVRLLFAAALVLNAALLTAGPAAAKIVLLGVGKIKGTAPDASDLPDELSDGTPHNQFGSAGSGIAYTGSPDWYVMVSDRGPKDGATQYVCRFHMILITVVRPADPPPRPVETSVRVSRLLTRQDEDVYVGDKTAVDAAKPEDSLRLDPEGVRLSRGGTVYVADEYGPHVLEFDIYGKQQRSFAVPPKFRDRQDNRGFEGLAISPDGRRLFAILQNCLTRDGKPDPAKGYVVGTNVRLLEIETPSKATREFVYTLDDPANGVCEILAVNDREFLVLERDSKAGADAKFKKLFRIDLADATDVSKIDALPAAGLPDGVKAVKKSPFLDLLDPAFGLAGPSFPEKVEGMTFGPDLPDGRRLLLVTTDNDFKSDAETLIYAFAVDAADLPGFTAQQVQNRPPPASLSPPETKAEAPTGPALGARDYAVFAAVGVAALALVIALAALTRRARSAKT